jgi:uncharacterized membrane protein YczE
MSVGILILGFSISLLRYSALGTDPYTTMNLGISETLNMSFGSYQLIVNSLLFILMLTYQRNKVGIGTVVNMVMVGFIADFFFPLVNQALPVNDDITFRLLVTIIAVFLACIGISMYMESELGIAPYDALTNIVIDGVKKVKVPFFAARMIIDIIAVTIGFTFGAIVGIATILLAFLTGPIVHIIRGKVLSPLLTKEKLVKAI